MRYIDLDVDFSKRYELIDYLRQRWGNARVAQIGAYGTLGARAVLREVARTLHLPLQSVNSAMDKIHTAPGTRLADIIDDLQPVLAGVDHSGRWLRVSLALEGLPHHESVHAAGVVLSDIPLLQIVPCTESEEGHLTTQMDMVSVENLGLLKLDVLGLRALSVADGVQRVRGDQFDTVDLIDPETLRLLGQGDTDGLFQLDGRGVKDLLQRMQPRNGKEIIDVVALYRPGPMDAISTYLARRAARETMPQDIFTEVCGDTYGVMVYQEQLMALVQRVGGYSLAEADLFRRAISKKDHEQLGRMGTEFAQRAREAGWSADSVQTIWTRILAFADYGFNKSHAAAYGLFSYYMAFLKAHYPLDFWAAEFSTVGSERLAVEMVLVASQGIVVFPPDVAASGVEFKARADEVGIQAGLALIRGVSPSSAAMLVAERDAHGPYQSRMDAYQRIAAAADSRLARTLTDAGALSALPGKISRANQLNLFEDGPGESIPTVNAEISFGLAWPVAVGPIYVRANHGEDVSWWQDQLQPVQEQFPGSCAVIVGKDRSSGYQVGGIHLDGSWQSITAVRLLPHVTGCGRQVAKKKGWNDGEDFTRGTG
jgi:DNA polymerase-3 subunit alpha